MYKFSREVLMTLLTDFTNAGRFTGKKPVTLSADNIQDFINEYGHEWVSGYLKAIEISVIEISNILMPSEDICGIPQTPHMVKSNLKKYWSHNKFLLEVLMVENDSLKLLNDHPRPL